MSDGLWPVPISAGKGKITQLKHGADWHTDHTNHVRPPKYTSLYAVTLPSSGGDTAIVNMRAGYLNEPRLLYRVLVRGELPL